MRRCAWPRSGGFAIPLFPPAQPALPLGQGEGYRRADLSATGILPEGPRVLEGTPEVLPSLATLEMSHFGRMTSRNAARAFSTPSASSAMGSGNLQRPRPPKKSLQCLLVNLLALVEVDGPPGVAIEAGVEEA